MWFFVNLAVLASAGWLVVRGQFRFSTFTSGAAQDRVERVTSRIAEELSTRPRPDWDRILADYERASGVEFSCYGEDGRLLAGRKGALPPEVHARLVGPPRRGPDGEPRGDRRRPPRRPGDGPPFGPGREPARNGLPPGDPDFRPFDDRGPDGRPPRRDQFPDPDIVRDNGRLLIQTHNPERYWVMIRHRLRIDDREIPAAIIASSDSPTGRGLYFDSKPFIWAGLGVLVLSALIWFPFVRGLTRSVGRLRDATGDLAKGKFDVRVNETRRDEVGELGGEINRMAERLAGYVNGQKRFLGDVAHELCAPIARLQTAVSIMEQRATDADKSRLADVQEEVEHMAKLVNELLQFSKASIGGAPLELREVSVREVAEKAIHREAGDTSGVTLTLEGDLRVRAEPDLLLRALGNLVRNAIRYAGQAGPITFSAAREGESVRISVADSGPGVPAEALPKIFDPLYRVDAARTHGGGGGIGLGLAIVKTCVDACGGTVTARNREQGGLEVTLTLGAV